MIYLDEKIWADTDFPSVLKPYFENLKVGIFDIETTGLSPDRCRFILGGLVTGADDCDYLPDGDLLVEQFFAETKADEEAALDACMKRLSELDVVITYNGARFDMPFIMRRAQEYGLEGKYDMPYNFDLYRMINKFSELRKVMPNLKQKTVENFFGLWQTRTDEIDGAESVELYEEWEKYGEKEVLEKILLHNSDDIKQLAKLVPIVKKADVHRGMANMGFPCGNLTVCGTRVEKDRMIVSGIQRRGSINYYNYDADASSGNAGLAFDGTKRDFTVTFPARCIEDLLILDLEKLLGDYDELKKHPWCESGYLVIRQGKEYNYDVINKFIRMFLMEFQKKLAEV
ncbi:MAG: ribonuclease H-like domain-containing protein [Firmicutes bacterium]|nr:ribonuclease H-like domain-containing protein [Bacillota bacterium]MBQ3123416.1 ribonuclease H-like domain-containing protein [Bacillota bacterium]MBQ9973203.1 ribonuclease H-like domain-containing protein [Bacillota bacterium]